jgi:uncharacterized protein (TIGR02265 family)
MYDVSLRPEAPLYGSLDIDALATSFPPSYTVKGMFVQRYVGLLDTDFAELAPRLTAAPRGGRYVAFKDYPQGDYTRIVAAAAAKVFPTLSLSEAVRRIARDDMETFSTSVFGKVVMTLVGDPLTALRRVPDAWARMAPGPNIWAEEPDARTIRLTFRRHRGIVEYTLGQLEGVVLAYGRTPSVTVRRLEPKTIAFDVVHAR